MIEKKIVEEKVEVQLTSRAIQAPMLVGNQLPQSFIDEQSTKLYEIVLPEISYNEVVHQSISQDQTTRIGIQPPARYRYGHLVRYALQVVEEVEVEVNVSSTYKGAISRSESFTYKPTGTPMASNNKLRMYKSHDEEYMSRVPYTNAVGSLMYAIVCT